MRGSRHGCRRAPEWPRRRTEWRGSSWRPPRATVLSPSTTASDTYPTRRSADRPVDEPLVGVAAYERQPSVAHDEIENAVGLCRAIERPQEVAQQQRRLDEPEAVDFGNHPLECAEVAMDVGEHRNGLGGERNGAALHGAHHTLPCFHRPRPGPIPSHDLAPAGDLVLDHRKDPPPALRS